MHIIINFIIINFWFLLISEDELKGVGWQQAVTTSIRSHLPSCSVDPRQRVSSNASSLLGLRLQVLERWSSRSCQSWPPGCRWVMDTGVVSTVPAFTVYHNKRARICGKRHSTYMYSCHDLELCFERLSHDSGMHLREVTDVFPSCAKILFLPIGLIVIHYLKETPG